MLYEENRLKCELLHFNIKANMILILTVYVLSAGLTDVRGQCGQSVGTTKNLREILIGKCEHYQRQLYPGDFCNDKEKNCTLIWENFARGVFSKPPCYVNRSDQAAFINSAAHEVRRDKAMFWSGVYGFVQRFVYLGRKYFALEDTLTGYMLDGTRFCGQLEEPGYNLNTCATYQDTTICVENSEYTMWTEVSKKFAMLATGHVHVMLNGTSGYAFSNESIFRNWELPQFEFPRVNKFTIFLAYSIGQTPRDFCHSPQLKDLQSQLTNKKIPWTCLENPQAVKLMLCEEAPNHPDCAFVTNPGRNLESARFSFILLLVVLSIINIP